METCALRHIQGGFLVVLAVLRAVSAGSILPDFDTDKTLMTDTYFTVHTADSETTMSPGELATSTAIYARETSTKLGNSSSGAITDITPSVSDTEQSSGEAKSASGLGSYTATDTVSWATQGTSGLSTGLLTSSSDSASNTTTQWDDEAAADFTDLTLGFSGELQSVTEARALQETDDPTDTNSRDSLSHTDRNYISTTISRAGERTLLSVTSNSTSPYTEDFNSSQTAHHTFAREERQSGATQGTGARHSSASTGTDTDQMETTSNSRPPANATEGHPSDTPSPLLPEGTLSQTGQPNVTGQTFDPTSEHSTPNSTPPLTVVHGTRAEMDITIFSHTSSSGGTSKETRPAFTASAPPALTSDDTPTNTAQQDSESAITLATGTGPATGPGTGPGTGPATGPGTGPATGPGTGPGTGPATGPATGLGTESVTGSSSATGHEGPGGTHMHTVEDTTMYGLTTAPPTLRDAVTTLEDSVSKFPSGQQPFVLRTDGPTDPTEVQSTVAGPATQMPHLTEEDPYMASTAVPASPSTTTLKLTSTPSPVTTWQFQPSTTVQAKANHTAIATTYITQTLPTTTLHHLPPSKTGGPQTASSSETEGTSADATTLHLETSTATPGNTTTRRDHTTASYSKSTPTRSSTTLPVDNHTERSTTAPEVTTTQMHIKSTSTPGPLCGPHTCANGGKCVLAAGLGFSCQCLPAWTGLSCNKDVDECVSSPCPHEAVCVNTKGSFSCECPLGFDLEDGRTCTQAKTFLGTFSVNSSLYLRSMGLHAIQREIIQLLNISLSILHGYRRSTLSKQEGQEVRISAVHLFSISANVTSADVFNSIQMSLRNCSQSSSHCDVKLHHQLSYHAESLCLAQRTNCDPQHSICTDASGAPYCQCRPGYFKTNPEDMTCRDCGDGLKLVNGTCVECMYGFGGFNCNNFYKLIAVVVAPASGALLLVVIIALIVTCCKKDKNDINKIIFKSGDLQMSPYADFPKSNRVSMEWGRETIEMQENGSTKNLLQMTDIYYSPALRNSDLERNGLYPFSGLPGSRHSCIYPAQWNPSFISDDSRRRDYF